MHIVVRTCLNCVSCLTFEYLISASPAIHFLRHPARLVAASKHRQLAHRIRDLVEDPCWDKNLPRRGVNSQNKLVGIKIFPEEGPTVETN
jgi:hypothetical protein